MMTILFDLDGTLLQMSQEDFIQQYFKKLIIFFHQKGYDTDLLKKAILKGISIVQNNDGSKTNEDLFWEVFTDVSSIEKKDIYDDFVYFYTNDFETIEQDIQPSPILIEAISILKEKGYNLICATNPMFPSAASHSRLRWSGVDTSAFEEVTTYETYHYCKPNVNYYREILDRFHLNAEDVLMVGNDAQEDGAIQKLNIPLYLINNHLIDRNNQAKTAKWLGSDIEFLELVKTVF